MWFVSFAMLFCAMHSRRLTFQSNIACWMSCRGNARNWRERDAWRYPFPIRHCTRISCIRLFRHSPFAKWGIEFHSWGGRKTEAGEQVMQVILGYGMAWGSRFLIFIDISFNRLKRETRNGFHLAIIIQVKPMFQSCSTIYRVCLLVSISCLT